MRPIAGATEELGLAGKRFPSTGPPSAVQVLAPVHCHVAVEGGFRHLQRGTNVVEADRLVAVQLLGENDSWLIRLRGKTPSLTRPDECLEWIGSQPNLLPNKVARHYRQDRKDRLWVRVRNGASSELPEIRSYLDQLGTMIKFTVADLQKAG
jgi:hypothetical protein